ncbi:hypothetical protein HHK36_013609 [Tetracentron sinense]|uniref:Uncharacterized protein n=1 Tax=Tetracentron sinense TaxID=13715 RepID=A0A834ZDS9_TETSI|nr:hypothetical protein HHK36_013609 [Tetracentron sinense]
MEPELEFQQIEHGLHLDSTDTVDINDDITCNRDDIGVLIEEYMPANILTCSSGRRKRGRGPIRVLNLLMMPTTNLCGATVRNPNYAPLQVEKWNDIPNQAKEMMWKHIKEHADVAEERRKWIISGAIVTVDVHAATDLIRSVNSSSAIETCIDAQQIFYLRAAGFLLPCYIMAWAINILQRRRQRELETGVWLPLGGAAIWTGRDSVHWAGHEAGIWP